MLKQLLNTITQFKRDNRVAVAQVDAIGHSMGGLLVRTAALFPEFVKGNGLDAGLVHKLITIGTPHLGSHLATELTALPSTCAVWFPGTLLSALIPAMNYAKGFTLDLATDSQMISALLKQKTVALRTHVIVGVASKEQDKATSDRIREIGQSWGCPQIESVLSNGMSGFFAGPSDVVVAARSQQGIGLGYDSPDAFGVSWGDRAASIDVVAGVIHSIMPGLFEAGPDELSKTVAKSGMLAYAETPIPNLLLRLVNSSASSEKFANMLP